VVWQDPENDWGKAPGGWNLNGATNTVFDTAGPPHNFFQVQAIQ
jgi:hypothetical protein